MITSAQQCDLVTPSCGRCTARSLVCSGAAQSNLLFLSENAIAQRNSWLARRPRKGSPRQPSSSRSQSPQKPVELSDEDLQKLYYWLSESAMAVDLPQPIRRDVETRAVERFFLDWTLSPSNDGLSPGYLYNLPALYASAQPGSVLWHAVRAVAFADFRAYDNGSFGLKARQSYGAALTRMRILTEDNKKLVHDRILAALLLIDIFELIYLARREPLGPHKQALRHILSLRGEEQLHDRARFELWRTAQQRLQAQRITQRDDPAGEEQLGWIAKLNTRLPDVHVCVDVEKTVVLCSAGRGLMEVVIARGGDGGRVEALEMENKVRELLQTMKEVVISMEEWASQVGNGWRPKRVGAVVGGCRKQEDTLVFAPPFAHLPALKYSDPWLAYKWNFHAASQIVLRQSMIEIIDYLATIATTDGKEEEAETYRVERGRLKQASADLATTIMDSCVPLLGFSNEARNGAYPRGKMVRRFFAVCAMWIVSRARFVEEEQRSTADEVLGWIERVHRLG